MKNSTQIGMVLQKKLIRGRDREEVVEFFPT